MHRLKVHVAKQSSLKMKLEGLFHRHGWIDDQVLQIRWYAHYHLANVVDDHTMEITHVIRGENY